MIPYVVTIVVLAGFVGKVRPPAAAGRAYEGARGQLVRADEVDYSVP